MKKLLIIILLALSFSAFSQVQSISDIITMQTDNEFVIDTSYAFGVCYIQEGRAGDYFVKVAIDSTKAKYIYWHFCVDTIPTEFVVTFGEVFRCSNGNHTLSAIEKED